MARATQFYTQVHVEGEWQGGHSISQSANGFEKTCKTNGERIPSDVLMVNII